MDSPEAPRRSPSAGGGESDGGGGASSGRSASDVVDAEAAFTPSPALKYSLLFLMGVTLLQVLSTSRDEAGPFDSFAEILLPKFLSLGLSGGRGGDDEVGGDMKCPPDVWLDEAFVPKDYPTDIYHPKLDPRNKVAQPTLFAHCALSKWVQLEKETKCPEGEEYVTIIRPPSSPKQSKHEGKIPMILHLSSPTNCLPSSTIKTLQGLIHQHESQAFTIYVHSNRTMDNILYQKEWGVFPQLKEGVMCGPKKLEAVARAALKELKMGQSQGEQLKIASEIGMGVKRDLWRLMVLWEYGGVTLDVAVLHEILSMGGATSPSANSTSTGFNAEGHKGLKQMMRQWSSETEADMLLYFISSKERIPFTDIMAAAPHHALVFYAAKIALKFAVWDMEKAITDTGRTTKVSSIRDGLKSVDRGWQNTKVGEILQLKNEKKETIRYVDGDSMLPKSLASPRKSPWRSIYAAFKSGGSADAEEKINAMMRQFAEEQKYVGPNSLFSCHEYTMDIYLQTTTKK